VTIAIRCGIAFCSFRQLLRPTPLSAKRRRSSVIIHVWGLFATCGPLARNGTLSGVGVRIELGNAVSSVAKVLAGLSVVLVVLVAGCATKGVPYKTPSSSSQPASSQPSVSSSEPSVSESPVPAASGQLTGTQLETVLLPQSYFPAGFALSSSGAVSSGGSLSSSPAQYDLATISCATFVNHLGNTGFGETAMASNSFVGIRQAFDQVVYQFGSAVAASDFIAGIKSLAARCRSFTASDNGSTVHFSLSATPGPAVGGHPSLRLLQTGTISGSSLVVLDTLLSASGVDVFAGAAVGLGAGAPASPAKETIVYNLMKRQAAAAVLG
jgi:hypothetical protein